MSVHKLDCPLQFTNSTSWTTLYRDVAWILRTGGGGGGGGGGSFTKRCISSRGFFAQVRLWKIESVIGFKVHNHM